MQASLPDTNCIVRSAALSGMSISDVHAFASLGSTSQWLKDHHSEFEPKLAEGRSQVCVTDWQQAGVGRRGNAWQTLPGNITLSIVSRFHQPASALMGLSLVTGIAVAEVLDESFGLHTKLKWPNDVILKNRKVGGLLTEVLPATSFATTSHSHGDGARKGEVSDVVTGIGINAKFDESVSKLGIGATCLAEVGFDIMQPVRDALVGQIVDRVLILHQKFVAHGWAAFSQDWESRDWLFNQPVSVLRNNSTEHTVARGVNQEGALLVECAGKLTPLYSGSVSVRPTL